MFSYYRWESIDDFFSSWTDQFVIGHRVSISLQMSQTVTLSASNTVIPRIGYGAGTKWYTGNNSAPVDKDLVRSIHEALSVGYRHLDAAEIYGTDTSIGEALRTQSLRREDIFITSKVYKNIEDIEKACLESLSRLGIEYLDLWLIHAPFFDRKKVSLEQAWQAMEKLVETGKVKAIGVSNFQKEHLEELLALKPKIKPAVNQSNWKTKLIECLSSYVDLVEFNPYVYAASRDLVEYCKANGIAIEAYTPLGPISYKPGGPVDEVLDRLAKKYNRSASQILLKWNLIKGLFAINGFSLIRSEFVFFRRYRRDHL